MTKKNSENSPENDGSELIEENNTEISNFELLYRKTPNPERDKSSGASSDEETTSSSLVPIPETLKHIRNKSKWTLSETGEHFGLEATNDKSVKPPESIINSFEEIRKKYTLKNERSVAMKMDSANMILDDILNGTNFVKSSTESLHSKSCKEQQLQMKTTPENESTLTESSDSHSQSCTHIFDHSHVPVAVDFLASQCPEHYKALQPFHVSSSSIDKGSSIPKGFSAFFQKKKALAEKFRNLQIGPRIQSVYKLLQKTKYPFAKNSKVSENVDFQQGIPGDDQKNVQIENEMLAYHCHHNVCPLKHYPKKVTLDLIEPSEMSSHEQQHQCTCIRQRECNCPEVIPRCICTETTCKPRNVTAEGSKKNSRQAESTECSQPIQESKKEDESSLLPDKEDTNSKTGSQGKKCKAWRKVFTEEKLIQRTDIYYFDHGNSAYYKTTDDHPKRYTDDLIERSDEYGTKFWAEVFGTLEIGTAFLITFIIQLYRFLFTSIIRSLLVGIIQVSSDYFFKPLLTILFNGIIQPTLILAYNIATSMRDLCLPVSQTFGFYAKEVANILRSLRIIEINQDRQPYYCRNKV